MSGLVNLISQSLPSTYSNSSVESNLVKKEHLLWRALEAEFSSKNEPWSVYGYLDPAMFEGYDSWTLASSSWFKDFFSVTY